MTIQSDAKLEFIGDVLEDSPTYIAERQQLAAGMPLTLTNTEFSNGSARRITVTSYQAASTSYGAGIFGTDINDQPIYETILYSGTAGTPSTGNLYFKTITSAYAGQPINPLEVSLGMSNRVVQTIPGRIRLKGYSIAYGGTLSGAVSFYDGVINIDTDLDVTPLSFNTYTYNSSNLMINFQIPGDGVLYKNGLTVTYQNAANLGSTIKMMNLFYG